MGMEKYILVILIWTNIYYTYDYVRNWIFISKDTVLVNIWKGERRIMFVNENSYKPLYKHKCDRCNKEIEYSIDNILIENKLIHNVRLENYCVL